MQGAERDWMTSREFLEKYDGLISKNTFYEQIRKGNLAHVKFGRKILVRRDALDRMLSDSRDA